jgi:hypothetical protein
VTKLRYERCTYCRHVSVLLLSYSKVQLQTIRIPQKHWHIKFLLFFVVLGLNKKLQMVTCAVAFPALDKDQNPSVPESNCG